MRGNKEQEGEQVREEEEGALQLACGRDAAMRKKEEKKGRRG